MSDEYSGPFSRYRAAEADLRSAAGGVQYEHRDRMTDAMIGPPTPHEATLLAALKKRWHAVTQLDVARSRGRDLRHYLDAVAEAGGFNDPELRRRGDDPELRKTYDNPPEHQQKRDHELQEQLSQAHDIREARLALADAKYRRAPDGELKYLQLRHLRACYRDDPDLQAAYDVARQAWQAETNLSQQELPRVASAAATTPPRSSPFETQRKPDSSHLSR